MNEQAPALADPPEGYSQWLAELKRRIGSAQLRAARAVNTELVTLYWHIGRDILDRQDRQGWGAKIVDRIAHDLRASFPDLGGFSVRNVKYMRAFAAAWPSLEVVQQAVAQLPWGHNIVLLTKLKDADSRIAYARAAMEYGWSRSMLASHIASGTLARTGQAVTNFDKAFPAITSDLARESLKDPYKLDFLGLGNEAQERDIEQALIDHITEFLVELGAGFAYVGRQVNLNIGGEDFFLDLLFYHLKLRCYVVIEIKAAKFKPEHLGQLGFYLAAVDGEVKHEQDAATIGLLLCKDKNEVVAEYALRNFSGPLGVAEYDLAHALPEELATSLPSIEQIEKELGNDS